MFKLPSKTLLAVLVCTLVFTGCTTTRNLLNTETYQKEIISHGRTSFCRVLAIEDKEGLRVSGELHLRTFRGDVPMDVDVALVDGTGSVIVAQKAPYYPRTVAGRKFHRTVRFSARFAEMPPAGTTIRVSNVN